jgi:hypothetical protein
LASEKSIWELSNGFKGARAVATGRKLVYEGAEVRSAARGGIASVISELMEYPVDVSLKPANCTSVWQNLNLS